MKRFNVTMTIELEEKPIHPWKTDVIAEGIKQAVEDFYWLDTTVNSIHIGEVERAPERKALPVGEYDVTITRTFVLDGKLYGDCEIITGCYKGMQSRWRIG